MNKKTPLFRIFATMFKIGLFTFGGGYAMIALLENEFVENKKWIENDEFMDLISISESTPGPVAINSATFIGYKLRGVWGSLAATLGVALPSFIIIYIISLFFDAFLSLKAVAAAFRGIQTAVIFLILTAGLRLFFKLKKTPQNIVFFSVTVLLMVLFSIFSIAFSSIYYILIGAGLSLLIHVAGTLAARKKGKGDET